jgi:protein TonB
MSTAQHDNSDWPVLDDSHKPNWLFRGLIFFSLGVHLLLILHLPQFYRPGNISRIELTLKQTSRPSQRQIPNPMPRLKPVMEMDEPIQAEELHTLSSFVKPLRYVMPKPVDPTSLIGQKQLPQLPEVEEPTVTEWQAEPETMSALKSSLDETPVMTEKTYIHLVQKQIEAVKQYPKRAQRRNEQGVVKMIFTIGNDGKIVSQNIIKSSGSRILDGAAVNALKKASPFARPPKGPIVIQLPIRFELL